MAVPANEGKPLFNIRADHGTSVVCLTYPAYLPLFYVRWMGTPSKHVYF